MQTQQENASNTYLIREDHRRRHLCMSSRPDLVCSLNLESSIQRSISPSFACHKNWLGSLTQRQGVKTMMNLRQSRIAQPQAFPSEPQATFRQPHCDTQSFLVSVKSRLLVNLLRRLFLTARSRPLPQPIILRLSSMHCSPHQIGTCLHWIRHDKCTQTPGSDQHNGHHFYKESPHTRQNLHRRRHVG